MQHTTRYFSWYFLVFYSLISLNTIAYTPNYNPESDPLVVSNESTMLAPKMDAVLTYPVRAMPVYEEHFNAYEAYTVNQMTPGYKEYSFGNISKDGHVYGRKFFRLGQGPPVETGGPLDLYVEGKAFFVIRGPWGDGYTRDGRFIIDAYGRLATFADHFVVLGEMGPLVLDDDDNIYINNTGDVFKNGQLVDRIKLVQFSNLSQIDSFNSHIFYSTVGSDNLDVQENPVYYIRQGYYEGSAVVKGLIGEVPRFKHGYLSSAYTVQRVLRMYQKALTIPSQ